MNYSVTKIQGNPTFNSVELTVGDASTTQVVVRSGSFIIASEAFSLAEDQSYTMVNAPATDVLVRGHLVKEIATGDPLLLVDEIYDDGVDVKYNFVGSPYELLHKLFSFLIPAGSVDHSAFTANVLHIVAPPAPAPEGEG